VMLHAKNSSRGYRSKKFMFKQFGWRMLFAVDLTRTTMEVRSTLSCCGVCRNVRSVPLEETFASALVTM
jgi:hypothetical protein